MVTSCRPEENKTYLTIGQDLFSINEYITSQYNYSLHHHRLQPISSYAPAAAMVYTDLEFLKGLFKPTDYGSGVEYADGIIDSLFPDNGVGLQIGLWLNGTYGCQQILKGEMDHQIQKLQIFLKTSNASAIFLRVGYEFDNPFFGYSDSPDSYVQAFQKIANDLRNGLTGEELSRMQLVWHSWAAPRKENVTLDDFYPGAEFVDWIGVSIFQQVFPWPSGWTNGFVDWGGGIDNVEEVLQFAKRENKPTMIAESTPFGGINMKSMDLAGHEESAWDRWYEKVIDLIERWDISMWSYINCDWDSQPMWHGVGFGDTRLSSNASVMGKWQQIVINGTSKRQFLMAGSLDRCDVDARTSKGHCIDRMSVALLIVAVAMLWKCCNRKSEKTRENTLEATPLISS